jgi:hypothetical protein
MPREFDIRKFKERSSASTRRFDGQLARLVNSGKSTAQIVQAVAGAMANMEEGVKSFVIYGEPQSGKTEMMICLTAKLLDAEKPFILHLLNDSVDLLGQSLARFRSSGLTPAARNFSEILDPAIDVQTQQHVVFCKKNGNDLRRLLDKIGCVRGVVVIDDEADYASPNSKINTGLKTPINSLIEELLKADGTYIGVTATPARLDLNNTFDNDSERWVDFPPHANYTGQDVFFPLTGPIPYRLKLLDDSGADPKHTRDALFRFLVTVAHLNLNIHPLAQRNYSFLVHTSGTKAAHKSDWGTIHGALQALTNRQSADYDAYVAQIWWLVGRLYPGASADAITHYVVDNIGNNSIVVLNSERDWNDNSAAATSPTSLFTIIIGGNIVSRGVTLDNLLAKFFTRDVKHKIQQDTYIQRARMFGGRGGYLQHFELTIPERLYRDWHRCFVFHRLSLTAIRDNLGSPVWIGDSRIAPVASASIDRSTVDLNKGEMSFPLFEVDLARIAQILGQGSSNISRLEQLAEALGDKAFPSFLLNYIKTVAGADDASVALHRPSDISGYTRDTDTDPIKISRKKGFFGNPQKDAPNASTAVHHIKVFFNRQTNQARLFYKFDGSLQFIKNR